MERKCDEKIAENKEEAHQFLMRVKEEHGAMKPSALRKEHEIQMKSLKMHHEDDYKKLQDELELQKSKEEKRRALRQLQWKAIGESQKDKQEVNNKKEYSVSSIKMRYLYGGKENKLALASPEGRRKDASSTELKCSQKVEKANKESAISVPIHRKEKYEKELKDARARELMYAEEAAILHKELNKEKVKAAATVKMLQEKAEQKLQEELQRKAEEAEMELKKVQELAKAELAAAIASEKAAQIEKIAEANLHINALCMAFYARSEEARQSHSIHKLALGTLALEDALSKGLPIRAEVDALHKSLEGIDRDSLLDLTLSSLPEEALNHGADTLMQLDQKFDSLKGTLRHFSLIPAGGGGLLAHTVAHIASSIKMKEDQNGDGIESVISKVESFLVQGKLAEAADALEGGVHGSEAQEVVTEWVRRARNRAMVEQALSLLQSYATSITFS